MAVQHHDTDQWRHRHRPDRGRAGPRLRAGPAPGYPDRPRAVADCLRVILNEEVEHHRYLVRDLAVLEETS
jgi:hypothetical protein